MGDNRERDYAWPGLRMNVRRRIAGWNGVQYDGKNSAIRDLCRMFGHKDYVELQNRRDDELWDQLNSLLGEHGYTLYKAMMARAKVG